MDAFNTSNCVWTHRVFLCSSAFDPSSTKHHHLLHKCSTHASVLLVPGLNEEPLTPSRTFSSERKQFILILAAPLCPRLLFHELRLFSAFAAATCTSKPRSLPPNAGDFPPPNVHVLESPCMCVCDRRVRSRCAGSRLQQQDVFHAPGLVGAT